VIFYFASVIFVTLYSLPPKFTIHSCLYVPKFIHRIL